MALRIIICFALCSLAQIAQMANAKQVESMKSHKLFKMEPAASGVRTRVRRSTTFNAEEIQAIVDTLNTFRRNVSPGPPSDMEYVEWNADLATMAQQWSEECTFSHGQPTENITPYTSIGQNLYASSGSNTNVLNALTAWNNEDQYYDYEDGGSCTVNQVCGHYTQNVWAKSNRIGCGVKYCTDEPSEVPWSTANIITCNYGPGGNYVNVLPYLVGPPCSECNSGVGYCDDGLCRPCDDTSAECDCAAICLNCGTVTNECTCSCLDGWHGTDCSEECTDTHDYCGPSNGWPVSWCTPERQYVLDGCPLMCGLCNVIDPNFVCEPATDEPPPDEVTSHAPQECLLECLNGGYCVNNGEAYCECVDGFSGPNCRRLIAYCSCVSP